MKTKTILILLLLVVIACGKRINETIENITFTTIAKGTLYGNEKEYITKSNFVISSQSDFNDLISNMSKINNISDTLTEKEIDFSKYQIIAIFDEVKSSGPSDITITKIVELKNYIEVFINKTIKDGAVMNQPYHIVKTPKREKNIILRK
ncbi:hypothetical protein [Capnocytophaga cynodegmi]|uniref:Lipoprotein n=1 Tax=Capnocytophaga cynodegmi TaxID=28189 RepID=A0A0B7HGC6_9FLAO|nr:hypothetical protein [Capnocytophaga cynodegmi]CEN38060.1 conserved exported hypothetical protein [Capnocytophaga cynodegmi]CEN38290.1 conserved exported hypothetical protein [Capnocytophaga cynodegmi]